MNPTRILSVSRRIFREMRNDRRTIALITVAPIFAMMVFGLAFSGEVRDVKVIVVNMDAGYTPPPGNRTIFLSKEIISNMDREVVNIEYRESVDEGTKMVQDGKAYAVIIFPENFTRNLYMKLQDPSYEGNSTITVLADKSNVNVAEAVIKSVNDAVRRTMEEVGLNPPVVVNSKGAIYGENADFIDFFVPGVMAFAVYLLTTLLTLISFVGERTSGTLYRILATPLNEGEIVAGYALSYSVVGTIQAALLLSVGVAVFHITIVGDVLLAFAVIAILAVVCQALGMLLSSFARSEAQAVQFLPFIVLAAFLLTGIFWPLEAIPSWLRPASYLVPPTYAADACRAVMLKGWGIRMIWQDIVSLLVFAAVFLLLAQWNLKRRG